MKLPNAYQERLSIEQNRLVLLPTEELIDIRSIQRGILFILAKWSVASQLSFRALNKALASLPKLDDLNLYIADTDSQKTEELITSLGDVPGGAGETYWLLDGQVLHQLRGYNEESLSLIQDYTKRILG